MNAEQAAAALVADTDRSAHPRERALLLGRAMTATLRTAGCPPDDSLSGRLGELVDDEDPLCRFVAQVVLGLQDLRASRPEGASRLHEARVTYDAHDLGREAVCLELMVLGAAGQLRPEDVPGLVGTRLDTEGFPGDVACRVLAQLGTAYAWAGRLIPGESALMRARDLATVVEEHEVRAQASAVLAKVRAMRGDLAYARSSLAQARRAAADCASAWVAHGIVECGVTVEFVSGQATAWRGLLELLVGEGGGSESGLADEYRLELATELMREGDVRRARRLVEALPDPPPMVPGAEVLAAWRPWLLDPDSGPAQEALHAAIGSATRPAAWVLRGRAAWLLGEHLTRAGSPAGRALLESAARTYAGAGAGGLLDRVMLTLHEATGVHVTPRLTMVPLCGERDLTTAERAVAAAVRQGLSNKEIAARTHVAVKTVEFHLANLYRKLGVRNRTELAVRLARLEVG
jgi:DNA-binding CsgD family transcriptional regulator